MLAVGWEAFEVYGVWNPSRPPDSPALPRPSRAALGSWKIAFGNTWVIAAIVVKLPCCPSPVALPALFRLWRGKGTASQVQLAAELIELLVQAFPSREVHGAGDACNRTANAVERTVLFAFLIQSLMICWYAVACDPAAGLDQRRQRSPRYRTRLRSRC